MALLLSPAAVKALLAMPRREREQLKARLDAIAAEPAAQHPSVTALQGEPRGRFRVRQGDYRAVFRIDGADLVVDRIAHRREVYER
jgi:mRNA interferase RelE/StbE